MRTASETMSGKKQEAKKFESKYGYFTKDGREYVITRPDTPRPWINVVCNGDFGFVVSQTGSGFTWLDNSNLSRVTRWEQDLIKDEWGKYIYIRDNKTGEFWSATWKPCCPDFDFYEARYGQGYVILTSVFKGIRAVITMFVDRDEPVEILNLALTNESEKERNLSLFSYFEFCLGNAGDTHREFQKTFIETEIDREYGAIYGKKRSALVPGFISTGLSEIPVEAFHAAWPKPVAYDSDKEAFFGRYGNILAPRAVREGKLLNTDGRWVDSVASLQNDVTLKPGETKTVIYTIGAARIKETSAHDRFRKLIAKYRSEETVKKELERFKALWNDFVDKSSIETPDEALNFMTNVWLKYQAIAGRLWARCAYYQSSGGIGFRDQLQDSLVFLPLKPELTRKQILLHAEQQFEDGTVHHWWHPDTGKGAVTHMTDDLLWLVFIALHYIDETNDETILDEIAPFLPGHTGEVKRGSIYDHCIRAMDKVLSRWSPRGLPLIGEGDWNDGLSHVGVRMKGESVWLGHFFYWILKQFAPICGKRGEPERMKNYLDRAEKLKAAINEHAWDGEWYIRATRDDGRPLGSKSCKGKEGGVIFLNAQTWAVFHGTATPERAKQAMASCEKHLFREYGALLFTPAYTKADPTIGYLSRYAPSIRENGGVYTHAATWAVQALCTMRNGDLAFEVYRRMCPIVRGLNPDLYFVEPYATPGNVDGPDSPNFGRGGWTWYTGSGAWMFRAGMNYIVGVRPVREGLMIDPVIPKSWKKLSAKRFFRGATYKIEIENPKGVSSGVKQVTVDGKAIEGNIIPPAGDGKEHSVKVVMG